MFAWSSVFVRSLSWVACSCSCTRDEISQLTPVYKYYCCVFSGCPLPTKLEGTIVMGLFFPSFVHLSGWLFLSPSRAHFVQCSRKAIGPSDIADDFAKCLTICSKWSDILSDHLKTFPSIIKLKCLMIFYTPVWKTDVLCYGNVRPSVRPSEFSGLFFNVLWDINLKLGICIQ